jgi:hypothetical protein
MSNHSVPYFLNLYNSVANDNCKVFFDFNLTGNSITNISGIGPEVSGQIVPTLNGFWNNSGNGFFSGNSVKITNTGNNINLSDSTYVVVYENLASGGGTLISTVDTGNNGSGLYYKGFEFGFTANNTLYFEYYTNNGPQVFTSSSTLSDKGSVYLTVTNNEISFGDYNYFYNKLNSNNFLIDSNYIFDPKNIYLGYNSNVVNSYNYNKRFTGYMQQFMLFSPYVYLNDIVYLNTGFAHTFIPDITYVEQVTINEITGYSTGIVPYYSGVTGYSIVPTGVLADDFCIEYTGYSQIALTGAEYGTGIIPLSGQRVVQSTGYSGAYVVFNSNFVNSFGRSNINVLKSIKDNAVVDMSIPTGNYDYTYRTNLRGQYDYVKNCFFNNYDANYFYYISKNGLAKISGINITSGSVYNTSNSISNDYLINSRNEVFFSDNSSDNDMVIIDSAENAYNTNLYIKDFSLGDCYSESAEIKTGFLATGQSVGFTGDWVDVSSGESSLIFIYASGTGSGSLSLEILSEISGLQSGINIALINNISGGYSSIIPRLNNNFSKIRAIGNGSSLNMWSWITYRLINSSGCVTSGYYPSGLGFILDWPTNNRLFFSGRKMISGKIENIGINCDYAVTPSGLYFDEYNGIFSYGSGDLLLLPTIFDYNITGNSNLLKAKNRYYTNYSEVYLSGKRLNIGMDYLELPNFDSNAGSGIFDINTDILYNSNILL